MKLLMSLSRHAGYRRGCKELQDCWPQAILLLLDLAAGFAAVSRSTIFAVGGPRVSVRVYDNAPLQQAIRFWHADGVPRVSELRPEIGLPK